MIVDKLDSHELLKPIIMHNAYTMKSSRRWRQAVCDIIGARENDDWEIESFKEEIIKLFKTHFDDDASEMNYWINKYPPGGFQEPHIHGEYITSFIYFVDLPKNSGDLIFGEYKHKAIEGTVCFFDSNITHHVTENKSNKDRITVAGNIW